MKRSKFIIALLASLPLYSLAGIRTKISGSKAGFTVAAGEGRRHGHIKLQGVNSNILDIKISGKDTDGALAMFEQIGLTPSKGTPLHVHPYQDEIFKIIEGEYYFQVGTEKYMLKAGDTIFLPRNVPHAWTQVSVKAKTNVIVQPAGKLEEFFIAIAALEGEPSKEQVAKIFIENEMEVVGPRLILD